MCGPPGNAYANATAFGDVVGASWRNPGFDQTDEHPVVEVSWNDAVAFCKWLSAKDHKSYRQPQLSLEWEYAFMPEVVARRIWGDDPDLGQGYANCVDLTTKEKFPNLTTFN